MKMRFLDSCSVAIVGAEFHVPERTFTNDVIGAFSGTSSEWIYQRTGIKERRVADAEINSVDLGIAVAEKLLTRLGKKPENVELLLVGSVTPPYFFPAAACLVQEGVKAKNAAAFDINAGCSSGVHALFVAANAIAGGSVSNALVIAADVLTKTVNWKERDTAILFGDGAAAVWLEKTGLLRIQSFLIGSDGSLGNLITMDAIRPREVFAEEKLEPRYIKMKGRAVFEFAVRRLPPLIQEAMELIDKKIDDIDFLIPHQANTRITQAIAERLKLPEYKVFSNIEKFGNTSSAAALLALADAWNQGRIRKDMTIVLASFGAGMTWSIVVVES